MLDKIRTTREQYLVAQILIASVNSVNAIHTSAEGETSEIETDINCVDKIACNVANFIGDNTEERLISLNRTIQILERAKYAAENGGIVMKKS